MTRKKTCPFCELDPKKFQVFWQSKYFVAFFDAFPVNPGHYCLIPKRHCLTFNELEEKEWIRLQKALRNSKEVLKSLNLEEIYTKMLENSISEYSRNLCFKALKDSRKYEKIDAFNIGINDGRAAGRTIDHLHIQVIPRYKGDVSDPTGGIRNVIPSKANYRKNI